jgi:hypothetical protein
MPFHFSSEAHASAALYDAALLLLEAGPYLRHSLPETGKASLKRLCNDIADGKSVLEPFVVASGFVTPLLH